MYNVKQIIHKSQKVFSARGPETSKELGKRFFAPIDLITTVEMLQCLEILCIIKIAEFAKESFT